MVFEQSSGHIILFGGTAEFDQGTKQSFDLGDTWEWTGVRWIELHPSPAPPGRSGHTMTYDTARNEAVIFGGRTNGASYLNDTWVYKDGVWTKVPTPSAPSPRRYAGAAYDPLRDRTVLFGGSTTTIPTGAFLPVTTNDFDTWEFDGTTWTQRGETGPSLVDPTLTYDATRHEILMLGTDLKFNTKMYRWNGAAGTWTEILPTTIPKCALFGSTTYEKASGKVLFGGGLCGTGAISADTYEWDGSNWTLLTPLLSQGLVYGYALTYDDLRAEAVMFGGTTAALLTQATPTRSNTLVFVSNAWIPVGTTSLTPEPRSRFVFQGDPVRQVVWLYGGVNESTTFFDFWQYTNGRWSQQVVSKDTDPIDCVSPAGTFDTDRSKLIMVCENADVYEYDGTDWKKFQASNLKTKPPVRGFSSVAYDPLLKKTVMFGGFDGNTYFDQTWTWDGAAWSQVQKNRPTSRMQTAMFFDPVQKKIMIYGGIGRLTTVDRITRYDDMWSFDGNGWTKLSAAAAAGIRYGADTTINPDTGHVTVYGGVHVDTVNGVDVQKYANDQWDWDGTKWTQINPPTPPPARENTGYELDPSTNRLVIFGGYAGSYFSDLWQLDPTGWHVVTDSSGTRRRIAIGGPLAGATAMPGVLTKE